MITVLVRHKVADFTRWKSVFDGALDLRRERGEQQYKLFHDVNDPNDLTVVVEFKHRNEAEAFFQATDIAEQMQKAGVIGTPQITYLTEMHFMRRTAAD